jgi:hypothetical protein
MIFLTTLICTYESEYDQSADITLLRDIWVCLCKIQWYPDYNSWSSACNDELHKICVIMHTYSAFFVLEIKQLVLRCDKGEREIAFKLCTCVYTYTCTPQ